MDIPKKYCHHCGKQIAVAANFCSFCGTSQASIDERPPVEEPRIPNTRVQPHARPRPVMQTFRPMVANEDEEDINADNAQSLSDLGIDFSKLMENGFSVDMRVPVTIKETVGSLYKQGEANPQPPTKIETKVQIDHAAAMAAFKREAGTQTWEPRLS